MQKKNYLPVVIAGLLFLAIFIVWNRMPEEAVREFIKGAGIMGPVLLTFSIWLTYLVAPFSGSPFLLAGFYLFGPMVVFYHLLASIVAGATNFWVAKIWGKKLVEKLAGSENLGKIDKWANGYDLKGLFFLRIFMAFFNDLISYAFGLTNLRFWPYFIVSVLGMIPGNLFLYFLSERIHNAVIFTIIAHAMGYVALALYIFWLKIKKRKTN